MNSKKRIAFAAIAATGLVAPLGLTMSAAHADSDYSYLIGTVTDSSGHPLAGAYVDLRSTAPGSAGSGASEGDTTDRNGRYMVTFDNYDLTHGTGWTITASRSGFAASPAQPVSVAGAGQNAAGPSIALAPASYTAPTTGVVLTGTVNTPSGPANGGYVYAFDAATGAELGDSTDTGYYAIHSDGHYYVQVDDPSGYTDANDYKDENLTGNVKLEFVVPGYLPTWYGGGTSKSASPVITVPGYGQPTGVANGSVAAAQGTIVGAVKLPAAGANWSAYATVYDLDGNEVGYGDTDAAGNFSVDVAPGTYYVRADGARITTWTPPGYNYAQRADRFDFVAGYYGKKATSLATATKIVVGANQNKSVGTITLTNALHATEKPFIKVKKGLHKGGKLSVNHGTWNHQSDVAYSYAWKVGKKTVGTKSNLKISKKVWKKLGNGKKVKKLTVTVTATDKYGELVNGSVKQKVVKALAKEQKQAAKGVKKAQKQAHKVEKQTSK